MCAANIMSIYTLSNVMKKTSNRMENIRFFSFTALHSLIYQQRKQFEHIFHQKENSVSQCLVQAPKVIHFKRFFFCLLSNFHNFHSQYSIFLACHQPLLIAVQVCLLAQLTAFAEHLRLCFAMFLVETSNNSVLPSPFTFIITFPFSFIFTFICMTKLQLVSNGQSSISQMLML